MKLNLAKCTFRVTSEKFLKFMVSDREIKANLKKTLALTQTTIPKTINEVQRLTGRMATLSQFVSKSIERCLPFFQILKKPKDFEWTEECQKAFKELKAYLNS